MTPTVAGLVSVVLPAWNAAKTVGAAVESCLAQTYRNLEIIVVNDGSTDGTGEVLRSFGAKIIVVSKTNGGLASARNAGVRQATGEYVAWMDADDLMVPDRIMLQIGLLQSDPTIEVVSSDFGAFVNADSEVASSYLGTYYGVVGSLGGLTKIYPQSFDMLVSGRSVTVRTGHVYLALLNGNFVHPPTVMVRRDLFDRIGLFDETIRYTCDVDFIMRAARTGRFAYIDAPLLRYRLSDTQMSHDAAGGAILLETADILKRVMNDEPNLSPSQRQLFRRRFAELHLLTAGKIGPSDRRRALRLLVSGIRHKSLWGAAPGVFLRIVVPRAVAQTLRPIWRLRRLWAIQCCDPETFVQTLATLS